MHTYPGVYNGGLWVSVLIVIAEWSKIFRKKPGKLVSIRVVIFLIV